MNKVKGLVARISSKQELGMTKSELLLATAVVGTDREKLVELLHLGLAYSLILEVGVLEIRLVIHRFLFLLFIIMKSLVLLATAVVGTDREKLVDLVHLTILILEVGVLDIRLVSLSCILFISPNSLSLSFIPLSFFLLLTIFFNLLLFFHRFKFQVCGAWLLSRLAHP